MTWLPEVYDTSRSRLLKTTAISEEDKKTITYLIEKLLATKIQKNRAVKYLDNLRLIVERGWLESYQDLEEQELYQCLSAIEHNKALGIWAKRDYKIALKRVLEELDNPLAKIINTNKGREKQQMPKAFLTVGDILKVANSSWPYIRDMALLICLYESCCRPHEFILLKRQDVRFDIVPAQIWDGNGGKLKIDIEIATLNISNNAKTGGRPVPLVFSVPWLKAWIRQRKAIDCQDDNIWAEIRGKNKGHPLKYHAARKTIKEMIIRAGIEPAKAHFYAARHGRSTEVCKYMTQAQQSEYAGWVQGSRMPRTYIHLSGKDVIAPLLSPFGITVESAQSERETWLQIMKLGKQALSESIKAGRN